MKKSTRKADIQLHNNYDYLNFIKQNHMQIENHKNIPFFKINNNKIFDDVFTLKRNLVNPQVFLNQEQQIFVHPQSKKRYEFTPQPQNITNPVKDEKYLTHDTLIQIMQIKNQQIAEALMKQRQNMSDVVYFGPNNQYVRSMQKKSSPHDKTSIQKLSQKFFSQKKSIANRLLNQPIVKFPQLVNKKITYNNGMKRAISKDRNNDQSSQTKNNKDNGISNIVQMQIIQNQSSFRPQSKQKSSYEHQKNQQILNAYYKNKVAILSLKEQPYDLIPQYKHPRITTKKYLKGTPQQKKQSKKKLMLNFQKQRKMQLQQNLETPLKNFLEATMKGKYNTQKNDDRIVKKGNFDRFPYKSSEVIRQIRRVSSQDEKQVSSTILKPYVEDFQIQLVNKQQQQQFTQQVESKQIQPQPMLQIPELIKDQSNNLLQQLQSPQKSPTKKSTNLIKNKSKNRQDFLIYQKQKDSTIYQGKIRSYREFLFQMNLVHRMFDALVLKDENGSLKQQQKYTYYVGKGNNSLLIKSLMKRRFWWTPEEDPKKANFVWTQLKINSLYQNQPRHYLQYPYDKVQQERVDESPAKSQRKKQKKIDLNPQKSQKTNGYKPPLPPNLKKIFTSIDEQYYNDFMKNADFDRISNFQNRLKYFPLQFLETRQVDRYQTRIYNHLEFNYHIGNKKALFYNLKQYYDLLGKNVFDIIPFTFHIQRGTNDPEYARFLRQFKKIKATGQFSSPESPTKNKSVKGTASKNVWIVKPGQLSNRGNGITVIQQVYQLNNILKKKQKHSNGVQKTYIVQKYIQKPLLYNKRKFDLRHYMIATRMFGRMRAYWYGQGYVRTSCYQYDLQQIDNEYMHLTNDAIQKDADIYGKYQQANKISYNQLQRYLDSIMPDKKVNFAEKIYPRMRQIALDAFKATYMKLDPNCYDHNFQVFGLDFMIDSNLDVWLIEVNTNPCLEINCNILNKIIPNMIEQCLRLSLDVIFPPFTHYPNSQKYLAPDSCLDRLQYELIFDSARDGKQIQELYKNVKQVEVKDIDEDDEIYQNQGRQLDLDRQLD